jgi:hypothetical protein
MGRATDWWRDHVDHTKKYVDSVHAGDRIGAVTAIKGLWQGVQDFGDLAGDPLAAAIMGEHTIVFKTLADSSSKKEFKPEELTLLTRYAKRNADSLKNFLLAKFPNLPKDQWTKLFNDHVTFTIGYIDKQGRGDVQGARGDLQKIIQNRDVIAAFTEKMFPASGELIQGIPNWMVYVGGAALALLVIGYIRG